MSEKLKPCPFCGGTAIQVDFEVPETDIDDPNFGGSAIECLNCHATTAVVFGFKENLNERWNERVQVTER